MKKILLLGVLVAGFLIGTLVSLPSVAAQAIAPIPVIRGIQCRVDYFVNNTPWEEAIAGGNLNVMYLLKTTEKLPNGQYQTGIAVCWDDTQYNWNYTYR